MTTSPQLSCACMYTNAAPIRVLLLLLPLLLLLLLPFFMVIVVAAAAAAIAMVFILVIVAIVAIVVGEMSRRLYSTRGKENRTSVEAILLHVC